MREELEQVLLTYVPSKQSPFLSHPLAHFLRSTLPNAISKEAAISTAYKVEGSAGKGNWAEVPWVCIFDKEITLSAQKRYYIVYLFRADMKGVYLSLNQGWTQYGTQFKPVSQARKKIQEAVFILRDTLDSYTGFDVEEINLAADTVLGKGYEFGHICGKYYEAGKIPNDLILIDDLRNLIGVYRELKGELSGKPLIQELEEYQYKRSNPYVNEGEKPHKEEFEKIAQITKDVDSPEQIDAMLQRLEKAMEGRPAKIRQKLANAIVRNQKIAELVKQKAQYICGVCGVRGFEKQGGGLYAEVHHIQELGDGGVDLSGNMICVCPTCHRKIHYGKTS